MMEFEIAPMKADHWPAVCEIYAQGIATGNATFETELPDWEKWDASHRRDCRLVAQDGRGSALLGWAALSPVSTRRAYAGVAEASVYVAAGARGRGVGRALLQALIEHSENAGIWTLQAVVFPENAASLALLKAAGFREVGVRQRIAKLAGCWRDTILLERRSPKIGMP